MRIDKAGNQDFPYSYMIDNIKALLIFLVVFNHMIAFQLVRENEAVRHIWYAITMFHMPAFVFVSGYLSKHPQDQMKNFRNLFLPYILGYILNWYVYAWNGQEIDFEILRPSGTVMWYLLALLVYRLTIEALGRIRLVVVLGIVFSLWAGTRAEFSTYLSASRIVVFFPFFVAGYLWKSSYTQVLRSFRAKWILLFLSGGILFAVPQFMISHRLPIDLFRGNHSYQMSGLTIQVGIVLRLLMYLVSFILILAFFALIPDIRLPVSFIGRNTMSIYFFHYPLLIVLNGLMILRLPQLMNLGGVLLLSAVIVLVLGCPPVHWLYRKAIGLVFLIFFRKEARYGSGKSLEDEIDDDISEEEDEWNDADDYEDEDEDDDEDDGNRS